jgi:hypothetical protein
MKKARLIGGNNIVIYQQYSLLLYESSIKRYIIIVTIFMVK